MLCDPFIADSADVKATLPASSTNESDGAYDSCEYNRVEDPSHRASFDRIATRVPTE